MEQALKDDRIVVVETPDTIRCQDCPLVTTYRDCSALSRGLRVDGRTYGVLTVSVPARFAKDEEEQSLFSEVVSDLAFALHRIEAVAEAQREHQRTRCVVEAAQLGTWEWNVQTGETVFNGVWAGMLGYTIDELSPCTYSTWKRLLHPDDLDDATAQVNRCATGAAEAFECEFRMRHRDGHWVWILDRGRVMTRDSGNRPLLVFGTHMDISARKHNENEVRRHAERLRALSDILQRPAESLQEFLDHTLSSAIALTQSRIGYIYLYDEDRREFVLNSWSRDVMAECRVVDPQTCYELDSTGVWGEAVRRRAPVVLNDFQAENPLKKGYPEGHVALTRFLTVPVFYQGRIVAVAGVANKASDYTETDTLELSLLMGSVWKSVENMRNEEAVRERQRYLNTILETMADGFWALDQQGRVVEVNQAYCAMSGYAREQLIGLSICDLDADEEPSDTAARIQRIKTNGHEIFETRHRRRDGSVWPAAVTANWVDEAEGRFVCFCRDLTERREREERIALLGQMLDEAPASITIHDTAGRFLYANRQTLTLHGYDTESEFLALNLHDLDMPESEALLRERFDHIAEHGEARFEVEHHCRNGSTIPLEVLAKSIEWNGSPAVLSIATDIRERRTAEERLRFQSLVLNQIADRVTVTDLDGVITYVNQAEVEALGYSRDDLVGSPVSKYGEDPERGATQREIIEETLAHGHWRGEVVNQTADGGDIILDSRIQTILNDHGERVALCGIATDITERKRTEEELAHSHRLMRYIIEHTNSAVAVHDRDMRYIYISQRYLDDYGVKDPDVIGKSHYDVFPDLPQKWRDVHRRALAGEISSAERDPYYRADGTVEWTRWQCRPWYEADGTVGGVVVYTEVITERVLAEEALRESEERQRAMIAASPLAIVTMDPEGRVVSWNTAAERIFGWTAKEVVNRVLPSVSEDQLEGFSEFRRLVLRGESLSQTQLQQRRKDGATIDVSLSSAPVRDREGRVTAIMLLADDVTLQKEADQERERMREQLVQAQRMESIGRLAGGVAHDFNNLLMGIMNYVDLCCEQVGPDHPVREWLDQIRHEAERSANLTRQLLAFARRQTVAPRMVALNHAVQDLLNMLRRLIGEDINLVWKPAPGLWPLRMDPGQIDQILTNLCVNARDAIAGVGCLTIETGNTVVDDSYSDSHLEAVPGEYVMLAVSDDGQGMTRDTLEQVFDPFFTTKAMGEGTGLGLATVYGIVKQNEGFVNVYSEPGQGTTFRIYIPRSDRPVETAVQPQSPAPEPVPAPTEPASGTGTILLVEDEKAIRYTASLFLEDLGYTVLTAESPAAALELTADHPDPILLLITDVVMPGMSGRDLALRLTANHPSLKVLYISGYTANVIAHRGILEDGVHFLSKPISRDDLVRKVREIIGE
jgi:PAS domain S-box-containing protein